MRGAAPLFAFLALAGLAGPPRPAAAPAGFLLGGVQVNEPDHAAWLAALEREGFDTVEVTVYARQGDWDTAELSWQREEPWVLAEARAAKARGLHVVLVLRVALDHAFPANRFFWHGMIMPEGDAALDEWFRRYGEFVAHWASAAETVGIDVLAIGSELNSMASTVPVAALPVLEEYWGNAEKVATEQGRILARAGELGGRLPWQRGSEGYASLADYFDDQAGAHRAWARRLAFLDSPDPVAAINARRRRLERGWSEVIARARAAYSGRLTYAANFDQYGEVGFWQELDLLAINAYFPLRDRLLEGASEAELEETLRRGWRRVLAEIDDLRAAAGVPDHRVLFSELGYTARANSTLEPWAATGVSVARAPEGERLVVWEEQPADARERALAVRALRAAHREAGDDLLAGILYWKLSTVPSHRDVEPFVLVLGEAPADPLLAELQRFVRPG